ncbi:MAG: CRISPR-associated endonuclease Cas2 [Alphaproteobacteria bacterium]
MSVLGEQYMWIFVFFDLPVETKTQRRRATKFRKWLLKDGYIMIQFSVYARICNGLSRANKHITRLERIIPPEGSVRSLIITDKQYGKMKIHAGDFTLDEKAVTTTKNHQLSLF